MATEPGTAAAAGAAEEEAAAVKGREDEAAEACAWRTVGNRGKVSTRARCTANVHAFKPATSQLFCTSISSQCSSVQMQISRRHYCAAYRGLGGGGRGEGGLQTISRQGHTCQFSKAVCQAAGCGLSHRWAQAAFLQVPGCR